METPLIQSGKDVPALIGPYRIITPMGRGGMGIVYRAVHVKTGQTVALKTVRIADEKLFQRLRREIHALTRISHPRIVRILDEGIEHGYPWYAMELLQGKSMFAYVKRDWSMETRSVHENTRSRDGDSAEKIGTEGSAYSYLDDVTRTQAFEESRDQTTEEVAGEYPSRGTRRGILCPAQLKRCLTIIERLCQPLSYLHGEGIVHCDLKPDNIIVNTQGQPFIVDFGLVSQFSGQANREILFAASTSAGTVNYMAPEQIKGEFLDARVDLYALGCILYELLCGFAPFNHNSLHQVIRGHLNERFRPLSTHYTNVPEQLETLLQDLLAKKPEERLGYAEDVALRLRNLGAENGRSYSGQAGKSYLYRAGFSGRGPQLDILNRKLFFLLQKKGSLVLLGGESGVGKTRLAMEFARESQKHELFVLNGESSLSEGESFQLFRNPLRRVIDYCLERGEDETERIFGKRTAILVKLEPSLAALAGQMVEPEPAQQSANEARMRLYTCLFEVFLEFATEKPVVILLDDLQWADADSLEFLNYVARRVSTLPILVIATYRSDAVSGKLARFIERQEVETLILPRMGDEEVRQIINTMLAIASPPASLCDYLAAKSEGNPFFVAEYLRTAVEGELLFRDNQGQWQVSEYLISVQQEEMTSRLPLPQTLKSLLLQRLSFLTALGRDLTEIAAVIGREIDEVVLRAVSGFEDIKHFEVLDELRRRQILDPLLSGHIRFVHDQIREIIYQTLPEGKLRLLHRRVADKLCGQVHQDQPPSPADIAYHYERAGENDMAVNWYGRAAELAQKQFAHHDTVTYIDKSLELQPNISPPKRFELLHQRLKAFSSLGRRPEEKRDLDEMIGIAHQSGSRAQESIVLTQQINYFRDISDYEKATHISRTALSRAKEIKDEALYLRSLIELGTILNVEGQFQNAILPLEEALALPLTKQLEVFEIKCRQQLLNVYINLGHYDEAHHHLTRIQQISVQDENLQGEVLFSLGIIQYYRENRVQAEELFLEALKKFRTVRYRSHEKRVLLALGRIATDQMQVDKAEVYHRQALTIAREIGDREGEGIALNNLANNLTLKGRLLEARPYLEEALEISREIGDRPNECLILINLVECIQFTDWDKAVDLCEHGISIAEKIGLKIVTCFGRQIKTRLYLEAGDFTTASREGELALEAARELGDKRLECEILNDLSSSSRQAGNNQEAANFAEQALQVAKNIAFPLINRRALIQAAAAAEGKGDYRRARILLQQARTLTETLEKPELQPEIQVALAELALLEGDREGARSLVLAVLPILETLEHEPDNVFIQMLVTSFLVLQAGQDKKAEIMLAKARSMMQNRLRSMKNAEIRHTFLNNFPAHQLISSFS